MKNAGIVAVLFIILLCLGCKQTSLEPVPDGVFSYTSYDTTGVALVRGWFTMVWIDSGAIEGEWHFQAVGSPRHIGPQVGSGSLVGGVNGEHLCIELNPQFADNNLSLTGALTNDVFSGQWAWISYIGVTNHGPFIAARN